MIISLIGKSGSGKTTLAKAIAIQLRKTSNNIVIIDGDELREAIAPDLGFSYRDREASEARRSKLMKLLSDQGITVICAALSNYPIWRKWCRKKVPDYIEIYLGVAQEVLEERDIKGIYQKFNEGKIQNVVGKDIKFEEPINPDLVINNDGSMSPDDIVLVIEEYIINKF